MTTKTRCPACETIFRITAEQLRARGGRVRCGTCQHIFNAFDSLIEEKDEAAPISAEAEPAVDIPAPEPREMPALVVPAPEPPAMAQDEAPAVEENLPPVVSEPSVAEASLPQPVVVEEPLPEVEAVTPVSMEPSAEETVAQSTEAARQAGLVAAREITETPAYNRWAAGTLAGNPQIAIHAHAQPMTWPFVLVGLLLAIALFLQGAYHFRSELVQRLPDVRGVFAALDVDVPLPRNPDLVSIESSDLQSDNARGMLVLQATLKNRAMFTQAWPALELTLTDTHDTVVARRVLASAEYLPPAHQGRAFTANGEVGIRLWIEAKGLGAAGYRLYVFYP